MRRAISRTLVLITSAVAIPVWMVVGACWGLKCFASRFRDAWGD